MKSVCFIIGQHRSGSSLLAGSLNILGCDLGQDRSDERDEWNQLGYFENKAFEVFNEEIFRGLGTYWSDVRKVSFTFNAANEFWSAKRLKLRELIRSQFEQLSCKEIERKTLVIKDPRISLLIELYEAALDGMDDIRASFIFSRRSIEENAKSIVRRGSLGTRRNIFQRKMSMSWAKAILDRHIQVFEKNFSGRRPLIYHTYSNLFSNSHQYFKKIDSMLQLNLDFSTVSIKKLHEFIRQDLKHEESLPACKVIATYFGERRLWPKGDLETRDMWSEILKLEDTVEPGDAIDTVVVLHDNGDKKAVEFLKSINERPTKFGKIKILIRPWENGVGASFKSFGFAFDALENDYYYWIFNEDNVYIKADGYFSRSLRMLKSNQATFIAFMRLPNFKPKIISGNVHHGRRIWRGFPGVRRAISHAHGGCGLTNRDVLNEIKSKFGSLPYAKIPRDITSELQFTPSRYWYRKNEIEGEFTFTAVHYLIGGRVIEINHPECVTLYPGEPYEA